MKICIIGTENTHAFEFAKLINKDTEFSELELIGCFGNDDKSNEKIKNAGFCEYFAADPIEFTGKVDAAIITSRHGNDHYKYAMPFLKKGIPCFIDKPFAISEDNAKEMIETAKETKALISGGSSLKHLDEIKAVKEFVEIKKADGKFAGGHICAPINMVNDYGNYHFYAAHLIELLINTFGSEIKSIEASCKDITKNCVHVIFHYDGFDVTGLYYGIYHYSVTAYSKNGPMFFDASEIGYLNKKELLDFTNMLKTNSMPHSYDSFLIPVRIQNAIEKSFITGKEIIL